jgi:Fe-S cluster assembly protein SufD
MADLALGIDSPYTYIRHDKAGQTVPQHSTQVQTEVSAEGLIINIAANTKLIEPIILINSAANGNATKNIVNIGTNAQVQLVEFLMSDDQNSSNTVQTTINCSEGAQLKHCILEHASTLPGITQSCTTEILQAANSYAETNLFSFGGATSQISLRIALQGNNAHCRANSLAYTSGDELQTVVLKIEHMAKHCTSNTTTRNVLKDNSITDLTGKIVVHPGARKTVAELQIKNLLCSPKAQATNKPELEIFNDDVRCTHGSSSGQLDETALFYIRSRGIDLDAAIAMLINGFVQPVIASCKIANIADYVNNLIKGH